MTTVSVVIPSRDDADMLTVSLAALARQTRQPDEIVVVDNDSADATATVGRTAGARVIFEAVAGTPRAASADEGERSAGRREPLDRRTRRRHTPGGLADRLVAEGGVVEMLSSGSHVDTISGPRVP